MASWITAQLKAAEGLLEAVDKTVSRTVGTLGLAEGDGEQAATEYGTASRITANLAQASPAGLGYPSPYSVAASDGTPAYLPVSSSNLVGPTEISGLGTASSYYSSAAAAPLWGETRSTAPTLAISGPSSGRGLTGAPSFRDSASSGGSGGFTVKADAPIPFGGTSPAPWSVAPTDAPSMLEGGSRTGSLAAAAVAGASPALAGAKPPAAGAAGASSVTGRPSLLVAAAPHAASSLAAATLATASPAASSSTVASHGGPTAGVGGTAAAPPGPTASSRAGETGEKASESTTSSRAEGPGPHTMAQPGASPSGGRPAAAAGAEAAPVALSAPAAAPAPSAAAPGGPPAPAAAAGPTPETAAAAAPAAAEPAPAPGSPPAPPAASQPGGGVAATSPAAPAPVMAPASTTTPATVLASATTAAASTLASATTTAVTHSLSFFNLVLDDAADAAPADGAGGAAAAQHQQLQALSRTCEQLRKRLEASREENEQLEDMLARAEGRAQQEAALVAALREEVAGLRSARAAAEGGLAAQLAVARSSLAEVSDRYEASQRAVLVLEGQLAALEESSRRLMEQHNDREGGMVEALRSELAAAEARLAAEARAHAASRSAAAAREGDLEQQIAGSTAALADLTRSLEEANRKSRGLEEELVAASRTRNDLTAQVATLQRQLEDAGIDPTGPGGGGHAAAAAAAAAAELEVLRGELVQHQRAAQLARQTAETSGAQAAALAQEVEALRQVAEQRKDTAELEAQLREVSDMLYLKQTQMERLAAEKAAQQLKTERELEGVRQELAKLTRQSIQQGGGGRVIGDGTGGLAGGPASLQQHDVIPMDALGEPYQRLVRHNRVGRAVKAAANFLDSTASTTSFVLRQYPLARLALFAYAALLHLYLYLLIARMQRMATHFEAAAAAAAVAPAGGA